MLPRSAQLLSDDEVEGIHAASLQILHEVGLEVNNERARDLFQHHGCKVDHDTMRVLIPPHVVEEFMPMVPEKFTFQARNPAFDRTVPDDAPLFMTASSAPNIIDPVTGEERLSTSEDIARIAKLVNQLDGVDIFSVSALANDAPHGHYSLARLYTALKHCEKPLRASGDPGNDSRVILDLLYTIAGSEEAYKERPFMTHHYCPIISPLKMDQDSTEMMMFYTEQGLPSHPTVVPNAGLTSPMTLAGTLAQGNAEFLVLAVLMQMVKPGTQTLYSSLSTVGDMRSGAYAPGGIECGMLNMAHAQMARRYKVPCNGYVGLTNSKLVDAQAGLEKGLSCMGGVLAGMHILQVIGLIDALMSFDYGMAVIDNEMALMLKRMVQGMDYSRENLALEEIAEIGPGGMFIATDRTLERMENGAFMPKISDRETRQTWHENGATSAWQRAVTVAHDILISDAPSLFCVDTEKRIRSRYDGLVSGNVTMPDNWK